MSDFSQTLKTLFKDWKTIPNFLSYIRLLLIPAIAVLFVKGYLGWSIGLIALSGLTDLFDGKIARKFNQVSDLGKILDPVADKLTIITVAILLFWDFRNADDATVRAFGWVFLLFLLKDLIMIVGGLIMLMVGLRPGAAEIYGKVATCVFYGVVLAVIAFGPSVGALTSVFTMPAWLMFTLVIVALISTFVALLSYAPGTIKQFKEKKAAKSEK